MNPIQALDRLRSGDCEHQEIAKELEFEITQARRTAQFHKSNHLAAEAENERLKEEIERLNDRIKKWVAENNLLRADVERLLGDKGWYRDQLDRIANTNHGCESCHAKAEIARAAIATTEDEKTWHSKKY